MESPEVFDVEDERLFVKFESSSTVNIVDIIKGGNTENLYYFMIQGHRMVPFNRQKCPRFLFSLMGVVNVTLPENTLKFESRIFRAIRVRIIDNPYSFF